MPVKGTFKETAQGHRVAAELCFENAMYKAAASRYYYSLFISAKGILTKNYAYYTQFLEEYPNLTKQQRKRCNFPHDTIYIAITYYLQWSGQMEESEVEKFHEIWNIIYNLRIRADYEEDHISRESIMECRENFAILYGRYHDPKSNNELAILFHI